MSCTSQKLCEYACFLSSSFKSFFPCEELFIWCEYLESYLNFIIETFSSSELKLTLRGLNNCNKHVQLIDIYDLLDACLWSFMTMSFFGMLRASNLISRTPSCFNPTEQLLRRCFFNKRRSVASSSLVQN